MKGTLAIVGAGGHGRVVADCAEADGWSRICFFDDNPQMKMAGGWHVFGAYRDLIRSVDTFDGVIVAIGANQTRYSLTGDLSRAGANIATVIHPSSTVSRHASVGPGSVIVAGAVVNIGSRIGRAVVVNTGATVGHDCMVEDGSHIAPGARLAGGVKVGSMSWVGVGAVVREYTDIGSDVFVGAGAVVVKSVADGLTVVGNPARSIKR